MKERYNKNPLDIISIISSILGCILGASVSCLFIYQLNSSSSPWFIWIISLCLFHLLEFTLTARFQPNLVSIDSFLLNHSREYHIALFAAAFEYWLERLLAPQIKGSPFLLFLGIAMVGGGQVIRSLAMITAGSNFTHQVADEHASGHILVKGGIYSILRHPAYFGWFWWSIGSQVLLGNPICLVLYSLASWSFFANRIPYEELTLSKFFGDEYTRYARRTIIGIPFIKNNFST